MSTTAEHVTRGREHGASIPRVSCRNRVFGVSGCAWHPRGAGSFARARAGAVPLRAHARIAVHLLPWRRAGHGVRPGADTDLWPARATVWRRTSPNFGCSVAGAQPRIRHQRFRRDVPGPWEWDVKRLAASLEIAGRNNGFPQRSGGRSWRRRGLSRAMVSSPPSATSTSGTRARIDQALAEYSTVTRPKATEARGRVWRAAQRTVRAPSPSLPGVEGEPPDRQYPPLIVPLEELFERRAELAALESHVRNL